MKMLEHPRIYRLKSLFLGTEAGNSVDRSYGLHPEPLDRLSVGFRQ
jgi:hypothetical protein